MAEAILLILWVGTTIFLGWRIESDRKGRESHEWWLSDVKECLNSVQCEFWRRCQEIAEEEFSKLRFNECKYSARIGELEKAYKEEAVEKVNAQKRIYITTVPEHLIREYNRHISDIADTFRYFGNYVNRKEQK